MVEKIEKLPTDVFAETVRFVITLCGHVQWEEKHYKFELKNLQHFTVHIDILSSSYLLDVVLNVNSDC